MFERLTSDKRENHLVELENNIELLKNDSHIRCKLIKEYEEFVIFYRFCDLVDHIDDELFNSIVESCPADSIDYWYRCIESWTP